MIGDMERQQAGLISSQCLHSFFAGTGELQGTVEPVEFAEYLELPACSNACA